MQVHVLLFDSGSDQEGIHSLELAGRTIVLLFEQADDAERYAGLLAAQDFPEPSVEALDRDEMELFCLQSGYEARFVPAGFLPRSDEDRLLIAPPERNLDVAGWSEPEPIHDGPPGPAGESEFSAAELDALRRQLEGLL